MHAKVSYILYMSAWLPDVWYAYIRLYNLFRVLELGTAEPNMIRRYYT